MDICASNWNEDDASNTAAAPDGAPEGMAPSGVNNVLRAMMGGVKRWYGWSTPKATGGSGTAYSLSYVIAPGALVDGMMHLVQFHAANGAAATLNVSGLGAMPLHYHAAGAWRLAPSGLVETDQVLRVVYHNSSGTYRLIDVRNRTGEIVPYAGSTAPAGSLLCYGQAVSRTDYAGLFAAIGTAHGAGDGSTTFNVPDLRGRAAFGLDNMGGSSANRLSSVLASTTLGAVGGAQTESAGVSVGVSGGVSVGVSVNGTLTGYTTGGADLYQNASDQVINAWLSSHQGHGHPVSVSGTLSGSGSGSFSGSGTGSTSTITNVPPAMTLNYVIRT